MKPQQLPLCIHSRRPTTVNYLSQYICTYILSDIIYESRCILIFPSLAARFLYIADGRLLFVARTGGRPQGSRRQTQNSSSLAEHLLDALESRVQTRNVIRAVPVRTVSGHHGAHTVVLDRVTGNKCKQRARLNIKTPSAEAQVHSPETVTVAYDRSETAQLHRRTAQRRRRQNVVIDGSVRRIVIQSRHLE